MTFFSFRKTAHRCIVCVTQSNWVKKCFSCFPILTVSAKAQVIWGGMIKRLLIGYFIGNISAEKYQNPFTCIKIIASQRWDVFWDTVYDRVRLVLSTKNFDDTCHCRPASLSRSFRSPLLTTNKPDQMQMTPRQLQYDVRSEMQISCQSSSDTGGLTFMKYCVCCRRMRSSYA